jgi:ribosomal protein L35
MPKLKTRKSIAKRFNKRKNDVKRGSQNKKHNTGKKGSGFNTKKRGDATVSASDLKRMKGFM